MISDFTKNYPRIKENCNLYSGIEAMGVSEIYHNYSYLSDNRIVVLDIMVQDVIDYFVKNKIAFWKN
jgi:hypothetical protein